MALSRSRLELLRQIAEKNEWQAQRALAEAQRSLFSQQNTEAELRGYLGEYERQPLRAATPALLENQRQFLIRLRAAVETQQQHCRDAMQRVERARTQWMSERQELRVAEAMVEQGRVVDRRADERRAQIEMDDFAVTRRPPVAYAR